MPANNLVEQNTANDLPVVQFAKRSFLLISSSIARLAVQLVIIFLYSRHLAVADYGLYQSVWLYINIISIVSLFGLPALLLSISVADISAWIRKNKKRFLLYATALNFIPLVYILFAANEYGYTTKMLLVVLAVVQNIAILLETLLVKNKKEGLVFASNLIFFAGYLTCHLLVLYNSYSLDKLLCCISVLFIVKLLFLVPFCRRYIFDQSAGNIIPVGKQWFYLGINDVLAVLFKWLDKWIILLFISVTQFALYFNGSYEIPVFGLMLSAVGNIMLVDLSGQNSISGKKIKSLFENSSLLLAGIVFPSFCFLLFYNREIFTLLFSIKYIEALPVFVISIFVLPLRITNFTAVLQVYHRNDLIVKGAVLDLLIAIILMVVLYPLFQLRGFAAAFVISTYIQTAYYLWHTGKLINEKITDFFPFKKLLLILIPSVVITGAGFYCSGILKFSLPIASGIIVCAALISIFLAGQYKRSKLNSN
jgi:O-antigen/teichoic acid export membrane protein